MEKWIGRLWDDHQIKLVIDIRNLKKDKDQTCLLSGGFDKERKALAQSSKIVTLQKTHHKKSL